MLPKRYAPEGGELVSRAFFIEFLQPTAVTLREWAEAKAVTVTIWQAPADT